MMTNLFSIFDPSTSQYMSLNWLALFLPLFFLMKIYNYKMNRLSITMVKIYNFIMKDTKTNIKTTIYPNLMIFMTLFFMIYTSNMLSIFPFIFTTNSQLSSTLFLSIPLWLSMFLKGWLTKPMSMLYHLVPLGTPSILCPFMVIIETISNTIRPLTLAIRLTANMIAGHILISLSSMLLNKIFTFSFAFLTLQVLTVLEMSVAIIQGYVFIMLLSLYLNEI